MNRLLVDTNVVLDLLSGRKPFYDDASKLFSLANKDKILLLVSSLTFANVHYVMRRSHSNTSTRKLLRNFKILVDVCVLNDRITELALNDELWGDFENGLQYYTALENDATVIITRDLKDFKSSKIPIMTAQTYINELLK